MIFLKELRAKSKMTQEDVAKLLGVDRSTYSKYETGVSEPNLDIVCHLARIYEVTSDYLLGLSDEPNQDMSMAFSDIDPQINAIVEKAQRLSAEGLAKLDSIADDLVASGKYKRADVDELAP